MSVSFIDIVLIVVLLASLVYGLIRGVIRQIASLGGLVLGIVACRLLGPKVGELMITWFPSTFHSATAANIAGYILLFLLIYFTVGALSALIRKLTDALHLGWIDHVVGGLFAVFKWLVIMSILLNLWHLVAPDSAIFTSSTLMDGELFPFVMNLAPRLLGFAMNQLQITAAPII